ncbi:DUF6786 family protein [Paraglaciecola sp.]|uniref:DUF6786 family protein n=1 Tax=Paraglaciecola sp. TaxID=1920173 RepID=UPI003EF0B09C
MNSFRYIVVGLICSAPIAFAGPSFDQAIKQMSVQHSPVILKQGNSRAAILAEFQGRVMVTTANGDAGDTLGWANFDYLQQPNTDNNAPTGGASRLWFGPETGPYSLFFKPGKARTVENIYVQDAFSINPFSLSSQTQSAATFKQNINIQNHLGFTFELAVERKITLFSQPQIANTLDIEIEKELHVVGFGAFTKMTNIGKEDWKKDTGLLSLWELGAFEPSENTVVFMPIRGELNQVTSYFTPTLASHTKIKDKVVYYKADANYMNKIGIPPQNTLSLMGSYNPEAGLLTVFQFEFNPEDDLYNNSVWYEENYHPYKGDVINVFNDGLIDGEGPFGPFYEVETSSSAKALKVNQSHQHFQNTYHFKGNPQDLNKITSRLFGLSIQQIQSVFVTKQK